MDNRIPALIFGACLLCVGIGMLWSQIKAGRRRADEPADPVERVFFNRQHRRRLQQAAMIILIAVLINVGDLIPWQNAPGTFGLYWGTVLCLVFWVILLAVGDMLSTKLYSDVSLKRIRLQREQLEETAEKLRQAARSGRDQSN
jgi:hypothetical protein